MLSTLLPRTILPRTIALTALLLAVLLLSGCATHAERNRTGCCGLEINMSPEQVVDKLGQPDRTEAYLVNGEPVLYLFYQTRDLTLSERELGRGLAQADYTPLLFRDGKLNGWGSCLYNDLRELRPVAAGQKGRTGKSGEGRGSWFSFGGS